MAKDSKALDQLTKEEYKMALEGIQEDLSECVGDLIILGGYLASDLFLDSENSGYALMAACDIVHTACESIKKALSRTYPML